MAKALWPELLTCADRSSSFGEFLFVHERATSPVAVRVLFLADQFADSPRDAVSRYPGGAELTDQAVITACPWPIVSAKIQEVDPGEFREFDLLVLGNLQRSTWRQRREIARLERHILFEHDYRICRGRGDFRIVRGISGVIHRRTNRCVCNQRRWGDTFASARGAIFLTHRQLRVYVENHRVKLPFHRVLGCSVMSPEFFRTVDMLRSAPAKPRDKTVIVYSKHRVKGSEVARRYCDKMGWTPTIIRDLKPEQVWQCFQQAKRLVYLPQWVEPAGRLAVEARLLGCEVVSNEKLGVSGESWWSAPDEVALPILRDAAHRFWRHISEALVAHQGKDPG